MGTIDINASTVPSGLMALLSADQIVPGAPAGYELWVWLTAGVLGLH